MSVVKINALRVPAGEGESLEKRFAGRDHEADAQIGFESFQLLRPVRGEDRYFVVSTWASEDAYQAWRHGQAGEHHGSGQAPVAHTADLLEFQVVDL